MVTIGWLSTTGQVVLGSTRKVAANKSGEKGSKQNSSMVFYSVPASMFLP